MAIRGHIIEHYHLFFRRILYFWLVSLPYYVDAQISPAQVKAPLIIHFCENVTWNNAIKPPLVIGIYAETDDIFELLSGAKDKHTIQGYPYIVKKITDLTDISGCQALYYSTQDNNNLYALYKQAQQNNILLISDNAEDQLFIMINFVQVKDRLSFKVNMPNLSVSGFTITPNLLLNGGSVVDIKDAYQKFEQRLRDNQNKMELSLRMLNEKESQLSDKESVIRDKDLLIQQKEADILRFKNDIRQTEITARLLKEHVAQTNKVLVFGF